MGVDRRDPPNIVLLCQECKVIEQRTQVLEVHIPVAKQLKPMYETQFQSLCV